MSHVCWALASDWMQMIYISIRGLLMHVQTHIAKLCSHWNREKQPAMRSRKILLLSTFLSRAFAHSRLLKLCIFAWHSELTWKTNLIRYLMQEGVRTTCLPHYAPPGFVLCKKIPSTSANHKQQRFISLTSALGSCWSGLKKQSQPYFLTLLG